MPQTKSAKKALRQNRKRRLVNLVISKKLKAEIKKIKKNPQNAQFPKVQSLIDVAAKKRAITKSKAARLKSQLSKLLSKPSKTSKPNGVLTKKGGSSNLKKTLIK